MVMKRKHHELTLIFILFSPLISVWAQENIVSVPNPDPNRFKEVVKYFNWYDSKNSLPTDAVLFVGSSSIRFWQTARYFHEYPILNRGFGGAPIDICMIKKI
jgi:hypothetical protein